MIKCKPVFNYFKSIFPFILIAFVSCSLNKEKETKQTEIDAPTSPLSIQRNDVSINGISFYEGDGSQQSPFSYIINEDFSLETPSLAISDLFSNVNSAELETSDLAATPISELTVRAEPGSKLPIKLKNSGDDVKYAELYFQDAARLTNAAQAGEAVLQLGSRGKVLTEEEIDVTLYKKSSESSSYSVELTSLFDYDENNFGIAVFKGTEESGRAVFNEEMLDLDSATVITEDSSFFVEFTPKPGVDPLLHPARSQTLNIIIDDKIISSLIFNEEKWSEDQLKGGSVETARTLSLPWNEELNLLSYVTISQSGSGTQNLKVKLYSSDGVDIIQPKGEGGGTIETDAELSTPVFGTADIHYRFDIKSEPASALFELIGSDGDIEKKLYIKILLTKPPSPMVRKSSLSSDFELVDSTVSGEIDSPYELNVKGQEVGPSQLVQNFQGTLNFAVRDAGSTADFTPLTDPTFINSIYPGDLERSWLLRVRDPGSIEYEGKSLYFKLNFLARSDLSVRLVYQDGKNDGSISSPIEVTIPSVGLTLADLTVPNDRALSYRIYNSGSALAREGNILVSSLHIGLNVNDKIPGGNVLKRGFFTLSVTDEGDEHLPRKTLYFKLSFEDDSPTLKANIYYPREPDGSTRLKAISVPEIAQNESLILADLIASSTGEVRYSLLRQGEEPISLAVTELEVGQQIETKVGEQVDTFVVGGGEQIIRAVDVTPEGREIDTLYFRITFLKKAATLTIGDIIEPGAKNGRNPADAYVLTLADTGSMSLGDLTQNHAGQLSYVINGVEDRDAILSTVLKVGEGVDSAARVFVEVGEYLIKVTDSGNTAVLPKTLYFKVGFKNASALKKDRFLSDNGGDGSLDTPYLLAMVPAGETLVLANLTEGHTSKGETLDNSRKYYLDDSETALSLSVKELKFGTFNDFTITAGKHLITVEDVGSDTVVSKAIYFELIFQGDSPLKIRDGLVIEGGEGTRSDPYQLVDINSSGSLLLDDLTEGQTSESSRQYYLGVNLLSEQIKKLQLSNPKQENSVRAVKAGPHTIRVEDEGGDNYSSKSIYFEVHFKNASSFTKSSGIEADGDGTSEEAYQLETIEPTASLNLSNLTQGEAGALLYYLNEEETPLDGGFNSLSIDPFGSRSYKVTAGEKLRLKIKDNGNDTILSKTIHFDVIFQAPSPLEKNSRVNINDSFSGSSDNPYPLEVAYNESLTLADLFEFKEDSDLQDRLEYYLDGSEKALSVAKIELGDAGNNTDTRFVFSGVHTIKVSDPGNDYVTSKELHFSVTFQAAPSELKINRTDDSNYHFGSQPGTRTRPIQVKLAGEAPNPPFNPPFASDTLLNLRDLITGVSGEVSFFIVADDNVQEIKEPLSYKTPSSNVQIKVYDTGSKIIAEHNLYLEIVVVNSKLAVNRENYAFGDLLSVLEPVQDGTLDSPFDTRHLDYIAIAPETTITLSDLITGNAGVLSFFIASVDESEQLIKERINNEEYTTPTVTPTRNRPTGLTAVTIAVEDPGSDDYAQADLYLKLIVAGSILKINSENETYSIGRLNDSALVQDGTLKAPFEVRVKGGPSETSTTSIHPPIALGEKVLLNSLVLVSDRGTASFFTVDDNGDEDLIGSGREIFYTVKNKDREPGSVTIKVKDSGDDDASEDVLYLKLIVAASSLAPNTESNTYSIGSLNDSVQLGTSRSPFEVRINGSQITPIAIEEEIVLGNLIKDNAGSVSFFRVTVDENGKIRESLVTGATPSITPSKSVTIVARDQGNAAIARGEIYLKLIVADDGLGINKSSRTYHFTPPSGDGETSAHPFEVRIKNSSTPHTPLVSASIMNLSDLLESVGTLSFAVVGGSTSEKPINDYGNYTTPTITPTPSNPTGLTSVIIVVRDAGTDIHAKGELYLKLIVANSTLRINTDDGNRGDNNTYTFGEWSNDNGFVQDGTAKHPFEVRLTKYIAIIPGTPINLDSLIKNEAGDAFFFKHDFGVSGNLFENEIVKDSDGYSNITPPSADTVTIVVRDQGNETTAKGEIYLNLIVADPTLSIETDNGVRNDNDTYAFGEWSDKDDFVQDGTAKNPFEVRLTKYIAIVPETAINLNDLIKDNVGETSFATLTLDENELAKEQPIEPNNDDGLVVITPSEKTTIVVRDVGNYEKAQGELYLKLIVAANTLKTNGDSTYFFGPRNDSDPAGQDGTAKNPFEVRIKPIVEGSAISPIRSEVEINLNSLTTKEAGVLTFFEYPDNSQQLDNPGAYTTPYAGNTVTSARIVIKDSGSHSAAAGEIHFRLIVADSQLRLNNDGNDTYAFGKANSEKPLEDQENQKGTSDEPYEVRLINYIAIAPQKPIALDNLVTGAVGQLYFFHKVIQDGDKATETLIDNNVITPLEAGDVAIIARDAGSDDVARGTIHLKLIIADPSLKINTKDGLPGYNETYAFGEYPDKDGNPPASLQQDGTFAHPFDVRLTDADPFDVRLTQYIAIAPATTIDLHDLIKKPVGQTSFHEIKVNDSITEEEKIEEEAARTFTTPSKAGDLLILVEDVGDASTAKGEIYLKLIVRFPSLMFNNPGIPKSPDGSTSEKAPWLSVKNGLLIAEEPIDLTDYFKTDSDLFYENSKVIYQSIPDGSQEQLIRNPSRFNPGNGKSTIIRATDPGTPLIASKVLYLNLVSAIGGDEDLRYVLDPNNNTRGPDVSLTGTMKAGEIIFTVELLPKKEQVIYYAVDQPRKTTKSFKYLYKDNDGEDDDYDLVLSYGEPELQEYLLAADLPAGSYTFNLVKAPSPAGYTVKVSLTDADRRNISFDNNTLTDNNSTLEITTTFDAFKDLVIGADGVISSKRKAVRRVSGVQWKYQPPAPQISLFGGDNFSALAAEEEVGLTFYVRVPELGGGDGFELFSRPNSNEKLGEGTVASGEKWLEFKVEKPNDLIGDSTYQFFVKPLPPPKEYFLQEPLLASPNSVSVKIDHTVRESRAEFKKDGLTLKQGPRNTKPDELVVTASDGFKKGDKVFLLYKEGNQTEATSHLLHTFVADSNPAATFNDIADLLANLNEGTYKFSIRVVTRLGNKKYANFAAVSEDTVFDIIYDLTPPQPFFDFGESESDTVFAIKADESLADGAFIEDGLSFTDRRGIPLLITPSSVTYEDNDYYKVTLGTRLNAGTILHLAANTVRDKAANGHQAVQQINSPSLLSMVVSRPSTINADRKEATLTLTFDQKIDIATFDVGDDLEIVAANGTLVDSELLSLSKGTGGNRDVKVLLTAKQGFDSQVRVKMKADNKIGLPLFPLFKMAELRSELIDIDRKAPIPTLSLVTGAVNTGTNITFTVRFDEEVRGSLGAEDFQARRGNVELNEREILLNIESANKKTFTGTLNIANSGSYQLKLKESVVADTYGNQNSASATVGISLENTTPIPEFSAPLLPRHGGSVTLTITFPEAVTDFNESAILLLNDNVTVDNFKGVDQKIYSMDLITGDNWVSENITVKIPGGSYDRGSNPVLSYDVPVSDEFSTPNIVDATVNGVKVGADIIAPLADVSFKIRVAGLKGDKLKLFSNNIKVAEKVLEKNYTFDSTAVDIVDTSSKVNGSRPAYRVLLEDAQGNVSEYSNLIYVNFEDTGAVKPPRIIGPAANISFTDNFSSNTSSWDYRSRTNNLLPGPAAITKDGVFRLTQAQDEQYTIATQDDLVLSTQGKVVFEGTFIFGNEANPADGIAFFAYDAKDSYITKRDYDAGGNLLVTDGGLPSLFFAVGLLDYPNQRFRYAPPKNAATYDPTPTGGNDNTWGKDDDKHKTFINSLDKTTPNRLRVTLENKTIIVEHTSFKNGVIDESSWEPVYNKTIDDNNYTPNNIKIGFLAATGGANNYHAVDDLSVRAELYVPYIAGDGSIPAMPVGIALRGSQQGTMSLPASKVSVRISSGYREGDRLIFKDTDRLESISLLPTELTISAKDSTAPTNSNFLTALKNVEFSATKPGERILEWKVFTHDSSGAEIASSPYLSQIKVSP